MTAIVRQLVGLLALSLLFGCPASTKKKNPRRPTRTLPLDEGPWGNELAAEIKRYLEQVHQRVHRGWTDGVIRQADSWLSPDDPANRPSLRAEVEVLLTPDGQPREVRLRTSSGHSPFDDSAVRVMRQIAPYPSPPPSLQEKRATLRWWLHRDGRLDHPRYARLELTAMRPAEAFRLALSRADPRRALAVYRAAANDLAAVQEMNAALASASLESQRADLRRMAIAIAPTAMLEQLLWQTRTRHLWDGALAELVTRRAAAKIAATLVAAGLPSGAEGQRRVVALLRALRQLGQRPAPAALAKLAAAKAAPIAIAAADLVNEPHLLSSLLEASATDPERAGPLAAALRRLQPDEQSAGIIRTALSSTAGAIPTLEAICRHELRDLITDVARIAKSAARPTDLRVAAIRTIGCLGTGLAHLYTPLRSTDLAVKLAAIRAIGASPNNRRGAYRLVDVAQRGRGPARVAALAALARLAVDQHVETVQRLTRRLGRDGQLQVIPALAGYGDRAVKLLQSLAAKRPADPEIAAAVGAALAEIGTPAAAGALAAIAVGTTSQPADAMVVLLRYARSLKQRR